MTMRTPGVRQGLDGLVLAGIMAVALGMCVLAQPAQAAGATGHQGQPVGPPVQSTALAAQDAPTSAAMEVDDGKNCGRSRKRLFVEGEGWIVRRVTTCY